MSGLCADNREVRGMVTVETEGYMVDAVTMMLMELLSNNTLCSETASCGDCGQMA